MQTFVISGKAKTVFRLIELKAKNEETAKIAKELFRYLNLRAYYETRKKIQELKNMKVKQVFPLLGGAILEVDKDGNHPCPYNPVWRCNVDDNAVCAKSTCEPWISQFEIKEK
jgi:hypothetical protein